MEEKRDVSTNEPAVLPPNENPPPYVMMAIPASGPKAVEAGYLATTTMAVVEQPRQVQVVTYPFKHKPEVGGPICFSLLVLCCCCCPLGLVGLVFAIMAGTTQTNQPEQSMEFIRISNYVNIAGVVTGFVLITIRIILLLTCGV